MEVRSKVRGQDWKIIQWRLELRNKILKQTQENIYWDANRKMNDQD